ncbi:MAG TPA: Wzz/FepE/Etk N-terminal domain-containing protein [Clostridia bacterium]|nr:Wzz/FepE/Etk N-terminal domain-containing protein [Clostridia bacterium]
MDLETIDLREIFDIIRKRLLLIGIIVLVSVITAGVLSYFVLDKQYEATTSLILGKPNDYSSNPQLQYNDVLLYQKLVKTYGEIAKSRTVSEKVIDAMKLNITAEQLQAKITVTPVGDTELIRVKVVDNSPEMAANIANKLAEVFKSQVVQIMRVENVQVVDTAKIPDSPIKPRPTMNIAIAFMVALMGGVGLTFLMEYLDHTIKTPQDVEKYLELPIIGVIPDAANMN